MKYPAYPKYKDSGVQWLGEVPEHWEVKRSDGIIMSDRNQVAPSAFETEQVFHYSIPAVQKYGTGIIEEGDSIASAKQLISQKCLLVSKLNPRKATICLAEPNKVPTLCSTEFVILTARLCDTKFLFFFTQTELFRQMLDSKVQSVTKSHQRVTPESIRKFWAAWPSPPEQTAIADFLDRETGRIDTLVAKKRRLLELLEEKRTALISRTVTRGLPADVAREFGLEPHTHFKDSGIDWLGEVPEGWEVLPLRRLVEYVKTGSTPKGAEEYHFQDGGLKWYSPGDFSNSIYLYTSNRALSEEGKVGIRIFPPFTIMLVGIGATIGKVGITTIESSCNQQINAIVTRNKLNPVFATYYLKIMRDFIVKCGKYTTLPIINSSF